MTGVLPTRAVVVERIMLKDNSTQINVAQLLKEPIGATRDYTVEAEIPSLDGEIRLTKPVIGHVRLTRVNDGILVQGSFRSDVELTCDRCLGRFPRAVEVDVEEQYVPTVDVKTGKWLLTGEVDPALLIDDHHILDLEEVLRQAIYLELPLHGICRETCKGLCPGCGQDLNEGSCDCTDDEIDPRWEALKHLVED
jgi:uncharacterized protein